VAVDEGIDRVRRLDLELGVLPSAEVNAVCGLDCVRWDQPPTPAAGQHKQNVEPGRVERLGYPAPTLVAPVGSE
jgi:hypothetical protein